MPFHEDYPYGSSDHPRTGQNRRSQESWSRRRPGQYMSTDRPFTAFDNVPDQGPNPEENLLAKEEGWSDFGEDNELNDKNGWEGLSLEDLEDEDEKEEGPKDRYQIMWDQVVEEMENSPKNEAREEDRWRENLYGDRPNRHSDLYELRGGLDHGPRNIGPGVARSLDRNWGKPAPRSTPSTPDRRSPPWRKAA